MMVEMMLRMASWVAFQLARAPLVSKINPKLVKWLHTHSVCTWLLLSTTTWLRINFFLDGFVQTSPHNQHHSKVVNHDPNRHNMADMPHMPK